MGPRGLTHYADILQTLGCPLALGELPMVDHFVWLKVDFMQMRVEFGLVEFDVLKLSDMQPISCWQCSNKRSN